MYKVYNQVQDMFRILWQYETQDKYRQLLYQKRENIDKSLLEDAGIGIAPLVQTHITDYLYANGYLVDDLVKSSLVKEEDTSKLCLYHRYTLPVYDESKNICSFIGRTIDDGLISKLSPKWKSLSNTELFKRGDNFYGIDRFNKKYGQVILAEGIFDILGAITYGCDISLSIFGIQITDTQVHKLHQMGITDFIIALDNDLSGRLGTLKSILAIKAYNIHSYCAIMNLTEDIDEMSKEDFWSAYDSRVYIDEIHPLQIINDTLAQIDLTTTKHKDIMSNGGWSVILQYCDFFASPFTPDIKRQIQDTFGKNVNFKRANLNRGYYK